MGVSASGSSTGCWEKLRAGFWGGFGGESGVGVEIDSSTSMFQSRRPLAAAIQKIFGAAQRQMRHQFEKADMQTTPACQTNLRRLAREVGAC